jgi:hypothetical protein
VEVETGKSNVKKNLRKIRDSAFDRIIIFATSPAAATVCRKVIDSLGSKRLRIEQLTWLDVS